MTAALITACAVTVSGWLGFRAGIWLTRRDTGRTLTHLVLTGELDRDVLEHPERYLPPDA